MTAEVAIMNRSAVALAADSAVTFSPDSTLSAASKVFNSAEKLFMLLPGYPIGLLIYNHPEFMQLPWETVIKRYRDSFGKKHFATLQEYADDFIAFLSSPDNGLISEEQCNVCFGITVNHYLSKIKGEIVRDVRKRIDDKAKRVSLKEILEITNHWINTYYDKWQKYNNRYSDNEVRSIINDLNKYSSIITDVRKAVFRELPLSESNKRKLEEFCYSLFYKDEITYYYSGVVITGFGDNDLYPSCVEFVIENCFCGHLKYKKNADASINSQTTGVIIPFAQKDIVFNLLSGIHPDLLNSLNSELNEVFSKEAITGLLKSLKGLRTARKTEIVQAIIKLRDERQAKVIEKINTKFKKEHTNSILNTVALLPKDELANMSESLVSITSFMRRVSMDVETVGGPIDVAVISKKDGFIWIKRKHYFDSKFNPHFNGRYSSEVNHETKISETTG